MPKKEQISLDDWRFIAVFHNLHITESIKTKYAMVVPHNDSSTTAIRGEFETFSKVVDSFQDHCGREIHPSLLFLHDRVPRDLDAMIAFRNILALSTCTKAWEKDICYRRQLNYFKYSNYFDLFPYTLSKDGMEHLIAYTPSIHAWDDPAEFQGQCSPEIATAGASSLSFDEEIFEALIKRWIDYHVRKTDRGWASRALFRSLEMVYRASSLPFSNQSSLNDYGANLGLWISAFEILIRPKSGQVNLDMVLGFLEKARFCNRKLNYRIYKGRKLKNGDFRKLNLVQKTYNEMFDARNTFLHGNPIKNSDIYPGGNSKCRSLFLFTPVIYKCALMVFLDLFRMDKEEAMIGSLSDDKIEELSEDRIEELSEIISKGLERDDFETALSKIRCRREEEK